MREGRIDPQSEYLLTYTAKDPLVLGIGFAATRDLNSFFKYDSDGNPLAHQIKWVISRGDSQSGNFIRTFVHLGFNQDEKGRIVWDGAHPHIAARQLAMNLRFAVAGLRWSISTRQRRSALVERLSGYRLDWLEQWMEARSAAVRAELSPSTHVTGEGHKINAESPPNHSMNTAGSGRN